MPGLYRERLNVSTPLTTSIIKDLKVTIGLVYREYLRDYTHWAFGDNDVVYGDLQRFLTPEVLAFDIVSVISAHVCSRAYRTLWAGQLTVFRNNEWTRQLFKEVPGWRSIFARRFAVFFDERNMPLYVHRTSPKRVALIWAQISDHRGALRGAHLVWRAGRLLTLGKGGCVEQEDALIHLSNLNHNKQVVKTGIFSRNRPSAGSLGFVIDVSGTKPWVALDRSDQYRSKGGVQWGTVPCEGG